MRQSSKHFPVLLVFLPFMVTELTYTKGWIRRRGTSLPPPSPAPPSYCSVFFMANVLATQHIVPVTVDGTEVVAVIPSVALAATMASTIIQTDAVAVKASLVSRAARLYARNDADKEHA